MPRDILSDSLAALRIVEREDEENCPLEDEKTYKHSKKSGNIPLCGVRSYLKDDCACYYNYGLGETMNNHHQDPIYHYKTSSLPPAASMNHNWDEMICSALRLSPEDIANQLTLLDLPCFKAIQPEELTTCGWTKSNKQTIAPNVVAFTRRFNRVNFWTVQEILNAQSSKARAEAMSHFIKVGKKLHELNNLHSLFAIVSALRSASIYRLTKTWANLSKRDKQQFDKMAEIFSEDDNWSILREYMRTVSLPCIPYLGIFLTDLVYIDMAHPPGSPHRAAKIGVVIATLQRYQTSEYDVTPLPQVANYLNSVRYIEELQKFLEDDQYKLSLKLEPPSPVVSCAGSKESVKEPAAAAGCSSPHHLSPSHRLGSGSLRVPGTHGHNKFIPTHRKCRSLGSNIFGKGASEERSAARTPAGSVNLLDDTLLESPGAAPDKLSASLPPQDTLQTQHVECDYQGFVRRKTITKDGRKASLSSWQRYWLQISGNILIFYAAKSFKGSSRNDFRSERCKVLPIEGLAVSWAGGGDGFLLANHRTNTLYKFKTGSERTAKTWVTKIEEVSNNMFKPLPANLMSFE